MAYKTSKARMAPSIVFQLPGKADVVVWGMGGNDSVVLSFNSILTFVSGTGTSGAGNPGYTISGRPAP